MPSMPNGAMTRTQFDEARAQFKDRFLIDGTALPGLTKQHFTYTALADLVDLIEQPYRLVTVHYGLDEGSLRYGFSFTYGTRIEGTDSYVYAKQVDPTHLLTSLGFIPIPAAAWAPLRANYQEHLWTKRADGPFEKLGPMDALRCVFPWEAELEPLHVDNAGRDGGEFRMVIQSIALHHDEEVGEEGGKSPKGFRHGVAFFMEEYIDNTWVRLLGDAMESAPYRNRAADYGNLCPALCGIYTEV